MSEIEKQGIPLLGNYLRGVEQNSIVEAVFNRGVELPHLAVTIPHGNAASGKA